MKHTLKSIFCFVFLQAFATQSFADAVTCELMLTTTKAAQSISGIVWNDERGLSSSSTSLGSEAALEGVEVFEIAEDHKVAYRYTPAQEGKPTLVLLNGLIYSLSNWKEYYDGLVEQGYGVVLVSYSTQPESLSFIENGVTPHFGSVGVNISEPWASSFNYVFSNLDTQDLVNEVVALVDHLEIDNFDLVSLSYSSFVALEIAEQQKDRIGTFILQAPAVMPSNRYDPYGAVRHKYFEWLRLNPFSNADYLADYELYLTMYWALFQQYVTLPNRLIDFDKFFNGVYQMVRSVKWQDLKDRVGADLPLTHLFLASKEESELFKDQLKFWEMMAENESKGSLVLFNGSLHALPASATQTAIEMTVKAVEGEISDDFVEVNAEASEE